MWDYAVIIRLDPLPSTGIFFITVKKIGYKIKVHLLKMNLLENIATYHISQIYGLSTGRTQGVFLATARSVNKSRPQMRTENRRPTVRRGENLIVKFSKAGQELGKSNMPLYHYKRNGVSRTNSQQNRQT